jgi:hypothetical protein
MAAATRSGSTHIRNCFLRLGLKSAPLNCAEPGFYNEEHMPQRDYTELLVPLGGFCFYYHVRAIGRTVPILRDNAIKPVVTCRNVLDTMVSFRDSHEQGIERLGREGCQYIWLPKHGPYDWHDFSDTQKWMWIASNIAPWLFSFYVSWHESGLDCLFVNYAEHYRDEIAGMNRIIDHLGWKDRPTDACLASVTSPRDGRFNLGKTGRGREVLPAEAIELTYTLAKSWGPAWGPILTKNLLEDI